MQQLFNQYQAKRNTPLTLDQFTIFAEFFPSLLIIISDGKVDVIERTYLNKLADSLGDVFKADGLSDQKVQSLKDFFRDEYVYLLQNLEEWKTSFLEGIKQQLQNNPEDKDTLLQSIYLFAQTSEDVTEHEREMVEYLKSYLELTD